MISAAVRDIYKQFQKAYSDIPITPELLELAQDGRAFVVFDNDKKSIRFLRTLIHPDGTIIWPSAEAITEDELKYRVALICGFRFDVPDEKTGLTYACLHFGDPMDFLQAWARCMHFRNNTNMSNSPHLMR